MCSNYNNEFENPLGKLIGKEDVCVSVSEQFNRKQIRGNLESEIEMVWQNRLMDNPRLFNGTKFRLHSVRKSESNKLNLCIGVTCYKDFLGTNYSPQAKMLQELGIEQFQNSQAFLSEAIGVGALLLTSDDRVVIIKRSKHVAEDAGKYDRPGGHAEPSVLVGDQPLDQINVEQLSPTAVRDELFNSIVCEVRDEVNIPETVVSDPLLLGVYRNPASAGRPGLEFLVRCSLTSQQVFELYSKGTQVEADESTAIKFLSLLELKSDFQSDKMTNSLKSVLEYYMTLKA